MEKLLMRINDLIIDSAITKFDYEEFRMAFNEFPDGGFARRIVGLVIGGFAVRKSNDEIAESINNLLIPLSLAFPKSVLDDFLENKAEELEMEILALQLADTLISRGAPIPDVFTQITSFLTTGQVDEALLGKFPPTEKESVGDILELTMRPTFRSLSGGIDETENDDDVLYEQGVESFSRDVEVNEIFKISEGMEALVCSPERVWTCNKDDSDPDEADHLSSGTYRYVGGGKIHRL